MTIFRALHAFFPKKGNVPCKRKGGRRWNLLKVIHLVWSGSKYLKRMRQSFLGDFSRRQVGKKRWAISFLPWGGQLDLEIGNPL